MIWLFAWLAASLFFAIGYVTGQALGRGPQDAWEAGYRAGAWTAYRDGYRARRADEALEADTPRPAPALPVAAMQELA